MNRRRLLLASASPRRRALLAQLGLEAEVCPADIDERAYPSERATALTLRLARTKARHVQRRTAPASRSDNMPVVLAADTAVDYAGELFGKPTDRASALRMLACLSGRSHCVVTSVCVATGNALRYRSVSTRVSFAPISPAEAIWYWNTGEPVGKAGGYAIQGRAAVFVRHLEGSYSNVVGLPLFETAALLREVDIFPAECPVDPPITPTSQS